MSGFRWMWFVAACAVPAACTLNPQTDTPSLTGSGNDKGRPAHGPDAGVSGPGAGNSTGSGGAPGSGGFTVASGGVIGALGGSAGTADNKGGAGNTGNSSADASVRPPQDASTDSGVGDGAADASDAAKTTSDGGALKGP